MSADQRRRNGRGCYYCSQGDHYARDCPKKEEDRLKRLECFACGGSGHIKRNCPYLRGDGWENSPGYGTTNQRNARDCPKKEEDRLKRLECFACGGSGHMKRNCPYLRGDGWENSAGYACYGTTNQHSGIRASRSSSSPASPTSPGIEIAGKEGSTGQQGSAKERKGRIMRSFSEVDPGKPASMLYYPKKKEEEEEEDRLKQLECFACGGSGHIKRNCPYLRGDGWENSAGYGGTNQHGGKSVSRSSSSPAVSTSPGIEITRKEGSTEQHKRVEEKKDRSSSKIDPGTPATMLYSTVTAARKLSVECSHRVEASPPHEDQSTQKKVLRTSKLTTLMDDDPSILSSIKDAIPPVSSYNLEQTGDSTNDTPQTSESDSTSNYPTLESSTEGCATHLESNSSLKCLDQDITDHNTTSVETPAVRQTSKGAKSERKRRPSHYPPFVDTHCHLEYVFERYHHRGTFDDFADRHGYPTNFDGCITTFCDPAAFSSLGSWPELLSEPNVWGSFGIHPHNAKYFHSSGLEDKLLEGLQHPKCVAFGEIGLDYSDHSPSDPQTQREILRHQLQLVVPFGKPLVLHCREAEQDLFQILTERLPRDWPIHLHCFTGETRVAKQFMEEFPNLYLGVCGNVTNARQTNMRAVACDVALERLLIETDAPYHVPSNLPKAAGWIRNSHPALAFYVAKEIARLRKEDLSDVLKAVRTNTQTLYGV